MITLTLTKGPARGDYLLRDADGRDRGSLSAGWTLRHAEIRIGERSWSVHRRGWHQVSVGEETSPLVRLGPDQAVVPGPGPTARWAAGRQQGAWHGRLRRGAAIIDLSLDAPMGRRCDVQVDGDWAELDLLVLTACFALILGRRRRVVIGAGVQ